MSTAPTTSTAPIPGTIPVYAGSSPALAQRRRCAWVVLLMIGKAYAPGALVLAKSFRMMKTRHDLVCIVTDDVPADTRAQLLGTAQNPIYDRVIEVPYISHSTRRFTSDRQTELYSGWIDRSFTKWNCLKLVEYERVILIDADMLAVANCDDLFELDPPAASFTNPWAYPWRQGGVPNHYISCTPGVPTSWDLAHGARVLPDQIARALRSGGFVASGGLVLLEPSLADFDRLMAIIRREPVFGAGHNVVSGSDEVSIALLYAGDSARTWTNIHQRYWALPWKKDWVQHDIRMYHYFGRKPWDTDPDEWPDLLDWWRVADRLVAENPGWRETFYPPVAAVTPLDADVAQLRLTSDIRRLVGGSGDGRHRHRSGGKPRAAEVAAAEILERWLTAMAYADNGGDPPWARVYRHSTAASDFNQQLAADLAAAGSARVVRLADRPANIVANVLALIERRLRSPPRPTGGAVAYNAATNTLSYGAHYKTSVDTRLGTLIAVRDAESAARVALRYAVISGSGQQPALPPAHARFLYDQFRVRGEAFASPLDALLLGLADTKFCSTFEDTDGAYGSVGSFFSADLAGVNWLVVPPLVETVATRAARRIEEILLPGTDQTFFFMLPDRVARDAYSILRENPFFAAELRLEANESHYRGRGQSGAATYFALSTEGYEVRAGLEAALLHLTTI